MDTDKHYRILLIDHESADAEKAWAALAQATDRHYVIESAGQLGEGIARLKEGQIDGVLLDLFLPDCQGLATFERLWEAAPHIPILIVCRPEDELLAIQGVEHGAQDYLPRPTSTVTPCATRCAT